MRMSMQEHRQRASGVTNAVTLGDLQARVSDLRTESAPAPTRPAAEEAVRRPSQYLIVEPGTDPTTSGALWLSVDVSCDYGGGSIAFAGDGTPKAVGSAHVEAYPPAAP